MLKKFAEGFVFGLGFALSFVPVWYATSYLITPTILTSTMEQEASSVSPEARTSSRLPARALPEGAQEASVPFHEMPIEDQIKQASVIALAKFESSDGKMRAVITEFLKKEASARIHYNIGDEYPPASHYRSERTDHGDGVVIFFVGSPATMRMSMTFSDNRIRSLGDLPLELFKKKCAAPDA